MSAERGIGTVFSDLLGEITALFRNEIRLAKAEIAEKAKRMAMGVAFAVAGFFVALLALVFLLEAAVGGLMLLGLNLALSALIVAVVALLIGGLFVWLGISRLKIGSPARSKTAEQLRRDAEFARQQAHAS
jgi:uncharacterized integral membrane protein